MSRGDIANYSSVLENMEDARIETQRLVDKKIATRLSKEEVETHFSQGTISRLALIVKVKPDQTKNILICEGVEVTPKLCYLKNWSYQGRRMP